MFSAAFAENAKPLSVKPRMFSDNSHGQFGNAAGRENEVIRPHRHAIAAYFDAPDYDRGIRPVADFQNIGTVPAPCENPQIDVFGLGHDSLPRPFEPQSIPKDGAGRDHGQEQH